MDDTDQRLNWSHISYKVYVAVKVTRPSHYLVLSALNLFKRDGETHTGRIH